MITQQERSILNNLNDINISIKRAKEDNPNIDYNIQFDNKLQKFILVSESFDFKIIYEPKNAEVIDFYDM